MSEAKPASVSKIQRRKTVAETAASASADTTRRILCGGTAGMIAKSTFAPLDRIRMLAQTGEHGLKAGEKQTAIKLYKSIVEREGVKGLWAGNGANILRVFPSKGVVFTSNDFWRGQLRSLSGTNDNESLSGIMSFLAGGLSGMTATASKFLSIFLFEEKNPIFYFKSNISIGLYKRPHKW